MNRYSQFGEAQDVLDFHNLGRVSGAEVKRETTAFVRDAHQRGLERIRIVTGKGLHSAGKPVVRPQVERTLRALESEGLVLSFRAEKIHQGGDGAIFVRLASV